MFPLKKKTVHQLRRSDNFFIIVGPVDGLFLVKQPTFFSEDDVSLALWNPATRESWLLPPVSFEPPPSEDYDDRFDPLTRDYKVLYIGTLLVDGPVSVSVYSLRNNSWKNLRPDFPCLNYIIPLVLHISTGYIIGSLGVYPISSTYARLTWAGSNLRRCNAQIFHRHGGESSCCVATHLLC